MTTPCDAVIRSLEEHSSRLNKEAIIEAEKDNVELLEGFKLALSPFITFGVKKVPSFKGPDGQGLPWVAFKELCELLRTRQLTGDDAKTAIELALSASTQTQWNDWYRRILIKDLRCGVSEKTINKVVKNTVPLFECMLAHDGAKHEKKVSGVKLLEAKWDGVRCLTIINVDSKTVTQFTRNGKELVNFPHITDALTKQIDKFAVSTVIDGEMISDSFQTLMKQVHRKSDVKSADATLVAFDMLPLSEFEKGKSKLGQKKRTAALNALAPVFKETGCIHLGVSEEVDLGTAVGQIQFKEFNARAIDEGYEGIMIKDPNAVYECKRSASWLKQKPFIEVSLAIVAVEEGTGKNAGKLGAFVCEGEDDGITISVNCGSGFSDSDRDDYWGDRDNLPGQIVEIRADAITQNQDGSYSLRFPRFLRFRGFAAGEKL